MIAHTPIFSPNKADDALNAPRLGLTLLGQCHCGNLEHRISLPAKLHSITACVCRCGFCRLHQPLWLGSPATSYYLRAEDASAVAPYRLGHPNADYILCPHCGVVMTALTRSEGHWLAMVNAVTLVLPASVSLDQDVFHPGNESPSERKERRLRSWIGDISFSSGLQQQITVRTGGYDGEL